MELPPGASPGFFDWDYPLAADDQQLPLLPPPVEDVDDVAPTPVLLTADNAMLAPETRLQATDRALLKMAFYGWHASRTQHDISLQWYNNIKNHILLCEIFDAWQASQQPAPAVLPPTTDQETHQVSYPTPLTSNASEDITQPHKEIANQRPLRAPQTDANRES